MPDHDVKQERRDVKDAKDELRDDTLAGNTNQAQRDLEDVRQEKRDVKEERREDRRD